MSVSSLWFSGETTRADCSSSRTTLLIEPAGTPDNSEERRVGLGDPVAQTVAAGEDDEPRQHGGKEIEGEDGSEDVERKEHRSTPK